MSDPSAQAALEYERRVEHENYPYYQQDSKDLNTTLNELATANYKLNKLDQIVTELTDHIYRHNEISESTKMFLSEYYINKKETT